jgi:hypothetical protein
VEFLGWLEAVLSAALKPSIDIAQVAIFVAIVCVELVAIFAPPAVKPAVLAMGHRLTTGRIALIALIAVIVTRFLMAPCWVWQEEHQARLAAESATEALQVKLDERDHRRYIRIELGRILEKGRLLAEEAANQNQTSPQEEATLWGQSAEKFFLDNMDESYISRFRDESDLPIPQQPPGISDIPRARLWAGMRVRNARLQEFIKEYQN